METMIWIVGIITIVFLIVTIILATIARRQRKREERLIASRNHFNNICYGEDKGRKFTTTATTSCKIVIMSFDDKNVKSKLDENNRR